MTNSIICAKIYDKIEKILSKFDKLHLGVVRMANMFRESERHIAPTSLQDSVKTDAVIKNLWSWSSGTETLF